MTSELIVASDVWSLVAVFVDSATFEMRDIEAENPGDPESAIVRSKQTDTSANPLESSWRSEGEMLAEWDNARVAGN
jgi:hypothetical protein